MCYECATIPPDILRGVREACNEGASILALVAESPHAVTDAEKRKEARRVAKEVDEWIRENLPKRTVKELAKRLAR